MKRMMDVTISLIILLFMSPILLVVVILTGFYMGSPILFKQKRPGLNGEIFNVCKFRTMKNARDKNGQLLPDRERLTRFGKVIRKYSLDELPQLFNVIKGDMSLVGPRPLLTEYLSLYTNSQKVRHHTKPGITGWAQINGRNAITWEEKFALDRWYVENQTIILDIKILFLTIWKVMKREGITDQEHVSMKKFTGTDEVI